MYFQKILYKIYKTQGKYRHCKDLPTIYNFNYK